MSATKNELDIQGVVCPMTWVKTKMALQPLQAGEQLQVRIDPGLPMANLPRSVKQDGHRILKTWREADHYVVIIEKGRGEAP